MSTNTMSRSRFSRCATEPKTSAAMPSSASSRKSIAAYAASSDSTASPSMATRSATHFVAASFEPGSSARWATSVNTTRSTTSPSRRRPVAARRIAAPIPSRSHTRSNVHAPPRRRELTTSTSIPVAAAAASCGVRNREIDDTSRANGARSTCSARPKLWITFATGLPVSGCRSLCASCRWRTTDPSRLVRRLSLKYTPTAHHTPAPTSTDTPRVVCLHDTAVQAASQRAKLHGKACARPWPRAPPVMTATRPSSLPMV